MSESNIKGIGTDVQSIPKLKESMQSEAFKNKVFTKAELDYVSKKKNPF